MKITKQAPLVSDAAQHVPKVAVVVAVFLRDPFRSLCIAWSFHQSLTRLACRPAGIGRNNTVYIRNHIASVEFLTTGSLHVTSARKKCRLAAVTMVSDPI